MSDFMGDLDSYLASSSATAAGRLERKKASESYDLGMEDFLTLMVTELKSQSIDSTADTSEMLNQMVMMQMVSALTNMTEASIMGYAASLVGKTVTVGQYDSQGNLQEIVGTVTATGTMGGEQVVFIGDKYYYMNEIMAVGTLPKKPEPPKTEGETEGGETAGPSETEKVPPQSGEPQTDRPEQSVVTPPVPQVPSVPDIVVPPVPDFNESSAASLDTLLNPWN